MIKLFIVKTNPDWLEAAWIDEQQIHCESFSGHPEHIQMLKDKCTEFDTELTSEQLQIVAEIQESFVPISQEELDRIALEQKIQEANSYLVQTDWVETYKLRHDLGLELIPEDSSKWEVINKREEYKTFLKGK